MEIEHKRIIDRIHLLIFNTQKDITSTFLRFQEHYESPKFRGKIFSLEEFKRWYIKNSPRGKEKGEFTYYTDWSGFNIPSYVLRPFYEGRFDPLSEQERGLLELFKNEQEPYYLIGVHRATKNLNKILKHEIAHGLFYTDEKYRCEVLEVLKSFDVERIKEELRSTGGYHEQVLGDEVHAYSISSGKKLKTPIPSKLSNSLRKIYQNQKNNVPPHHE